MGDKRRIAILGAVVALATTMVVATGYQWRQARPAAAAGGTGCSTSALVPSFHVDSTAPKGAQFMISQGLPTYSSSSTDLTTNLVRGQDSLLRLFLSLPSCALNQSITVTGGS